MKNALEFASAHRRTRSLRLGLLLLATLSALAAQTTPVHGGSVLVMTVPNATVAPGGSGSFDIVLRNDATATESTSIAGFSVDLTVAAASGITFTGADDATSTAYIFAGNSLGFLASIDSHEIQANDFAALDGTTLDPGSAAVGLAHITFTADPGRVPGLIPVTLIDYQAGTSLSDVAGSNLSFEIVNGQITVTGPAVPEPSSIVMAATVILLGLTFFRPRRSSA
jgi:hypothetical protein